MIALPLRSAIRRAVRLSTTLVAAGLGSSLAATTQAGAFPPVFPLANLLPDGGGNGSNGFVIAGIAERDSLTAARAAGDINGDGIGDLVIGAPPADPQGLNAAGQAYIVFGRSTGFPATLELSSLLPENGGDGSAGFVIDGMGESDRLGSVSGAGDVNGDGIDDLIIGAPNADPGGRSGAGETYVVFGRNTGVVGNFPASFPVASLLPQNGGDGSMGFAIDGVDPRDQSGISVSRAGDVNADGIDDLIIGAVRAEHDGGPFGAGESYVVFGRNTSLVGNSPAVFPLRSLFPGSGGDGTAGFIMTGIADYDTVGASVSTAGDVNGDGVDDVIVGASTGHSNAGQSYVVFGRNTAQMGNFPAVIPLVSLTPQGGGNGSAGFVLNGINPGDYAGFWVAAAGDIDGDNIDDLLISGPHASPRGRSLAGESYVVFGRDSSRGARFPPVFPLAKLLPAAGGNGSTGFVLDGIDSNDSSGTGLGTADINADGLSDVLVGAALAGRAGEAYVVYGRETSEVGNFPAIVPLASLLPAGGGDGSAGSVFLGAATYDGAGSTMNGAGDLNGDGIDDLVIGAASADPGGRMSAGEVFVVFGRAPGAR